VGVQKSVWKDLALAADQLGDKGKGGVGLRRGAAADRASYRTDVRGGKLSSEKRKDEKTKK